MTQNHLLLYEQRASNFRDTRTSAAWDAAVDNVGSGDDSSLLRCTAPGI